MQINGTLILLYFIEMLPRTVSAFAIVDSIVLWKQTIKDNLYWASVIAPAAKWVPLISVDLFIPSGKH